MGAKSASECLCTIRSKLPTVFFSYFLGAYVVIALCNEASNKILLVHYCPFESTEESYKSVNKSKFSFFQRIMLVCDRGNTILLCSRQAPANKKNTTMSRKYV